MITEDKMNEFISYIKVEHKFYVDNISQMAASLPCCLCLLALYDELKPDRILDLGSGISSYCLRLLKQLHDLDTDIWSIDSDPGWLETSKLYCIGNGLDYRNFKTWDTIKDSTEPFDLIFVDIDMSPKRKYYFEPVFNQFSKPGTVVMLDDMHKSLIYPAFDRFMKTKSYKEIDIKALTLDEYGRFSRLVEVR